MDKQLIAERFARARNTYSQEARVQQQVAEKMMRLVMLHTTRHRPRHIVELGCGTGSYSRLLATHLHPDSLLLNDLCPEMAECLSDLTGGTNNGNIRFMPGDAEKLDFPKGTDLITSCSTLQWFTQPEHFFARCLDALVPRGILAFSTFGPKNMHEIRTLTGHGLDYPSVDQLIAMLPSGFKPLHTEEELAILRFPDPTDVLRHLRQTGVTGTEKRIWTRGRLQEFRTDYHAFFDNDQGEVSLTYHPIYIITIRQ